jgi:hypothetical protein
VARDEKGNVLKVEDGVCLRYPGGIRFSGSVLKITEKPVRRGSKKRQGSMIIVTHHLVELEDMESPVEGIEKFPQEYGAYHLAKPKGVLRAPKIETTRAKKSA